MSLYVPANFMPALPTAFRYGCCFFWQASQDGHQDDSAPGETFRTSWGIIQDTWDDAVRDGIVSGLLANATQTQAGSVLLAKFFNQMRLSMLPVAVAFVLFNDATLTGTGHATSMLQRIAGMAEADIDGVLGDKTLAATNAYLEALGPVNLVNELADADEEYLAALAAAPKNPGWFRREKEALAIALDIIAKEGAPIVTVVSAPRTTDAPALVLKTQLPAIAVPALEPSMLTLEGDYLVTIRRA